MGLPRGRRGWIALALVLASLLAVSAPLARARSIPPPADLLARWIAGRVDADRATVLVTSDVPYVAVFLEERAPRVQVESVPAAGLDEAARRLAAAGREAWSTAPSPLFPGEWAPVACFERAPWLESRGPDALWLYRRGSWGDADPGPCYGPQRPLP